MQEIDEWGRINVDPDRVFELLYLGTKPKEISCQITDEIAHYNELCRIWNKPDEVINPAIDTFQSQLNRLADWNIPDEYTNLNVRAFVTGKCKTVDEINRVNIEMDLYEGKDLINLLRLMIILVDHFRKKSIVWGVGRGSSCASYVLFLIGIHKIDSLKYDLDINEFLRQ